MKKLQLGKFIGELYKEKKDVKILEYGAEQSLLKGELAQSGYLNYLGICKGKGENILHEGIYYSNEKNITYKNNAEVLILNRANLLDLKNAFHSAADVIIYTPASIVHKTSFLPLWAYKIARKKHWQFSFNRFSDKSLKGKTSIVFERRHQKAKLTRQYLSPEVGLEHFFNSLNDQRLEYVILRWYEEIPFLDINEDIDLLISDDHVEAVRNLLNEKVGILPFDLYSISGLPGSDFQNMAYYPPYLASQILSERKIWNEKYYVPSDLHYFLSLMYHAVYHKGEKSGIPLKNREAGVSVSTDHPYMDILQDMSKDNGFELEELNLEYLHQFMGEQGWAPSTDTIRKLSGASGKWLEATVQANDHNFEKNGELMVFIIREWASARGLDDYIKEWFVRNGLDIVKAIELDDQQKSNAAQYLRGGNWGKGPWPVSGGKPSTLLVVYDYHPKPLKPRAKKKFPHVSNEHYLLKEDLRKVVNATLKAEEKTNPIHSSDDEIEALDYIMTVSPEILDEVKETIMKWDKDYATTEPILADLSENKRRAKVELIEYNGKKAVKKTYKAGKERFLEREKYVYGELSKECEFIPKMMDCGDNYIITPYFETIKFSDNERIKKQMLKKFRKEIFSINEFFYNKGYALIDFHPGNILITKEGIKVIDFEFLYQYEILPDSVTDSFDLKGFPDDFMEDKPYGILAKNRRRTWEKILY